MAKDAQREALEEEFTVLFDSMRPLLLRMLSALNIPPEDAEDLVQKVFVRYLYKRRGIEKPEKWLKGALRKECLMFWRTRGRRRTTAMDEAVLETVAPERGMPEQERRVLRRNLSRWISGLDYRCRKLLRLRYGLELDALEVAEEMHYKPSSIDKVTRRCLDALGRKLAAALPPGARKPGAKKPSVGH